jgi:predicted RNA-binding Zn-ribbon protein involved in translation (DUF1610 family)
MGDLINALCPCLFNKENLEFAVGPSRGIGYFGYPALCASCSQLIIQNYLEENPKCPKCGGNILFYDDPQLSPQKEDLPAEKGEKLNWEIHSTFFLNNNFKCPKCGENTMIFEWTGVWD